jgi:hypothetical protein
LLNKRIIEKELPYYFHPDQFIAYWNHLHPVELDIDHGGK